ncbi:MAG: hypothetical protein P1U85_20120 [Verrucomicrobiales bacterium]|nr:hypothetical protein [Verrucomicrobiales bacterium]
MPDLYTILRPDTIFLLPRMHVTPFFSTKPLGGAVAKALREGLV